MQKRSVVLFNSIVFSQVFLIILSVFSFAFLIGNVGVVSGQTGKNEPSGLPPSEVSKLTKGPSTAANPVGAIGPVVSTVSLLDGEEAVKKTIDADDPTKAASGGFVSNLFGGELFGGGVAGALFAGVAWGGVVYGSLYLLTSLFGFDENLSSALSAAGGAGAFAGSLAANIAGKEGAIGLTGTEFGVLVGIGVAAIVFVLLYKNEKIKQISFQCLPYQAPVGGQNCEVCNDDPSRPCSEYRCRSLGQACELVNPGTEEEKCVWVNPRDVESPTITPSDSVLNDGLSYTNHETRPPAGGTRIIRESVSDGCLQAFTALTFGVTTNEPSQCKIDTNHKDTFDEMQYFFGNSNYFLNNHTQTLALPSPDSLNAESPELQNDGTYELYIRCRDKNGNENVDEYAIQICVDPSPDTTPPVIESTSIISGSPVAYNVDSVPVEVYVNEPSECKWSVQDKSYNEMENLMSCATSLTQVNARDLYTCATTLTGVKNSAENNYYFRCKDQPKKQDSERNVNVNSYLFNLKGTQPLNILEVGPNETVTGNTGVVSVDLTVVTDDGEDEGRASCYFSNTGTSGSYVKMFETDSYAHRQNLQLSGGDYTYYIRCVDLGGNSDEEVVNFGVLVDTQAPAITRAYHDQANNALKIVTNEDAECKYSLNSCNFNFEEGLGLLHTNPTVLTSHFAEWKPNLVYYIKCMDEFGNQPSPNECSIVASATNII